MTCGLQSVKCQVCGQEVKRITSASLQGKTLCLKDHMKEIEKYRQHIVTTFDEEKDPIEVIMENAVRQRPNGYTLIALRRARNSTHSWEAEYEKTELFEMRCS
jgi:hypothetical protein